MRTSLDEPLLQFPFCAHFLPPMYRLNVPSIDQSSACVTSLPQLVTALVVFYGGLMVRNRDLSPGDLVSFLLYLQSLSDAFSSIGYIFASLTQAVGAADKGMFNDAVIILSSFEVYLPLYLTH